MKELGSVNGARCGRRLANLGLVLPLSGRVGTLQSFGVKAAPISQSLGGRERCTYAVQGLTFSSAAW